MSDEHFHRFRGTTTDRHRYIGFTGPNIGQGLSHTHKVMINIPVANQQGNQNEIETGPGINLPGGHVHKFIRFNSNNNQSSSTRSYRQITGPPLYPQNQMNKQQIFSPFTIPIHFFKGLFNAEQNPNIAAAIDGVKKLIKPKKINRKTKNAIKAIVRNIRGLIKK